MLEWNLVDIIIKTNQYGLNRQIFSFEIRRNAFFILLNL